MRSLTRESKHASEQTCKLKDPTSATATKQNGKINTIYHFKPKFAWLSNTVLFYDQKLDAYDQDTDSTTYLTQT
jgi:hypothetical protein